MASSESKPFEWLVHQGELDLRDAERCRREAASYGEDPLEVAVRLGIVTRDRADKAMRIVAGEVPGKSTGARRAVGRKTGPRAAARDPDAKEATRQDESDGVARSQASSQSSSALSLVPGARFAHFELVSRLGEGGMGVVFAARDLKLDRLVALKMIVAERAGSRRMVARFEREVRAAARLRHPGIVPIYEYGMEAGRHWYSMGLVEGARGLDRLLKEGVNPKRGAEIIRDAALAIHHAHENGVIHRDMKPANILVDAAGKTFVVDFGLARDMEVSKDGLTASGAVVGTPQYMAPEQFEDAREVGPEADVWALGAALYEVIEGRPPFVARTLLELAGQVRHGRPTPPKTGLRAPADLALVVMRALERDPELRYESALDLSEDIDRALRGEPIVGKPLGFFGRLAHEVRRRPSLVGVVLVSCLAVLVVTLAALRQIDKARESERAKDEALRKEREDNARKQRDLEEELRRERARAELAALQAREEERKRAEAEMKRREDERRRLLDGADLEPADARKARELLARDVEESKDAKKLVRLARMCAWAGDLEEAVRRYDQAHQAEPSDLDPTLESFLCRGLMGDPRAQADVQQAMLRAPNHPIIRVVTSAGLGALTGREGIDKQTEDLMRGSPVAPLLMLFVAMNESEPDKRYAEALALKPTSGLVAALAASHRIGKSPEKALALLDEPRDYEGTGESLRAFARAGALEALGKNKDAEAWYEKVKGPPMTALDARARRAALALERGDLEAAAAAFDKVEPATFDDRALYARVLLGLERTDDARAVLDRAAALAKKGGDSYASLRATGLTAEDLEQYQMVLGEDGLASKSGRRVLGRRARLAARMKDDDRARKDLERFDDDDAERLAIEGTLLLEKGDAKAALAKLDQAIALKAPPASDAWFDRARALEKLGDKAKARDAWTEVAKRDRALERVAKKALDRLK